jgi:hypothetical protein
MREISPSLAAVTKNLVVPFPDVVEVSPGRFKVISDDALMCVRWNSDNQVTKPTVLELSDWMIDYMLELDYIVRFLPGRLRP